MSFKLSPASREESEFESRPRKLDLQEGRVPPVEESRPSTLDASIGVASLLQGRFRHGPSPPSPPAEVLVRESFSLRFRDPARMLELAYRAVREADSRLRGNRSTSEAAELRALTWSNVGNSLRIRSQWELASEAFKAARRYQKLGNPATEARARHLQFEAALEGTRGLYPEAIGPLREAAQLHSAAGNLRGELETKLSQATYGIYSGNPEDARKTLIPLLSRARGLKAPLLLLSAQHNLVRSYIDLDRPEEAISYFSGLRPLYEEVGDPLILLRATWLEALLLRKVGHFRNAEAAFLRAQRGFEIASQPREAGQVGLQLAELQAALGRKL